MTSLIGQHIAQYIIESVLGNGRLGTVYKAKEANNSRQVALRIIDLQFAANAVFKRRFWDVTKTAVSLHSFS